jgi:KaiC/GvpD/RAD55 family RecA-like ATPase
LNNLELEVKAINCIIFDAQAISKFRSRNITKDHFTEYQDAAEFALKYHTEYKVSPPTDIFSSIFPDFPLEPVDSKSTSFVTDKLVETKAKRDAEQVLSKGIDMLASNPLAALDFLVSNLSSVRPVRKISKDYTDRDAVKRFELFLERQKLARENKVIGIKTGIKTIDDRLIGWQPGNLVGIIGRLGVGKSWLLMHVACSAYKDGRRVVYISPEMSIPEVEMRWDTVMAAQYNLEISNYGLQTGENIDEELYKKWLVDCSQRADWITLDSLDGKAFSVSAIQAVIEEYQPEILAVDGVALLSGNGRGLQTWEKIMEISYGLKSLASNYGLVIIASQQANRSAAGSEEMLPKVEQISFGDAFGQAADCLIGMGIAPGDRFVREINILKGRTGQPEGHREWITFDVDKGRIGGIISMTRAQSKKRPAKSKTEVEDMDE